MKLTFLGTAAATSCPLMFCRCEVCEMARKLGGPDFRKRSSLLINKDLLIDLGPDIMSASFMHGISVADVRYCLQTHSHSDHFDASHFSTRIPEYATINVPKLELYASRATINKMSQMLKREGYISDILSPKEQKRLNINIFPIKALQTYKVGKYRISAFPANHDESFGSFLYTITERYFTVFYGVDTDILPVETWQGIYDKKLRFDIVILDHTYGPNINGEGHLNANQFIAHIYKMRDENLLKKNARIFATHISHEGNPIHSEMVKYGKKHGYEIAYDGLVVKI